MNSRNVLHPRHMQITLYSPFVQILVHSNSFILLSLTDTDTHICKGKVLGQSSFMDPTAIQLFWQPWDLNPQHSRQRSRTHWAAQSHKRSHSCDGTSSVLYRGHTHKSPMGGVPLFIKPKLPFRKFSELFIHSSFSFLGVTTKSWEIGKNSVWPRDQRSGLYATVFGLPQVTSFGFDILRQKFRRISSHIETCLAAHYAKKTGMQTAYKPQEEVIDIPTSRSLRNEVEKQTNRSRTESKIY